MANRTSNEVLGGAMYACGEILCHANPEITIAAGGERFTLMTVEQLRDALLELVERRRTTKA
jgi:hypothetical protein